MLRWPGTALPSADVLAADERINWWARQLRAAGLPGGTDELRAQAFLDLLLDVDSRPAEPEDPASPSAAFASSVGDDQDVRRADRQAEGTGQYDKGSRRDGEGIARDHEGSRRDGEGIARDHEGSRYDGTDSDQHRPSPGHPPGGWRGPSSEHPPGGWRGPSPGHPPGEQPGRGPVESTGRAPGEQPGRAPGEKVRRSPGGKRGRAPGGFAARLNLTAPLATITGLGWRPGEAAGLGPVDPALLTDLVAQAARHPRTTWCMTVTDDQGHAIAHGCARPAPSTGTNPHITYPASASAPPNAHAHGPATNHGPVGERAPGPYRAPARDRVPAPNRAPASDRAPATTHGPAGDQSPAPNRAPASDRGSADTGTPASTSPAAGTRAGPGISLTLLDRDGPPGGYGTWLLSVPDGRDWTIALGPIATTTCDHRHQAAGHDPGVMLRHLTQIRHATCASPVCRRPATQCDFEHNTPYEAGGRTCECNGGPKCRTHHRLKQDPRWKVQQVTPDRFRWTTPTGRIYTTEPTRYPI